MLTIKKVTSIIFLLLISFCFCSIAMAQEITMVKSYYQQEIGAQGQVPRASEKCADIVTFYDNGLIKLMSGTVWRFRQNDFNGNHIYVFVRNEGIAMPNTYYQNCVFNSNYSIMQTNFSFGMMGMMMQQYALYRYLGEGTQPAYDWMSGNY